ncbi:MAG: hypothetical protein KDD64_15650 [Bdellovibrionales bacterium]|nr:hypothetical protein [Bdellovibrionales bacterium]
MGNKKYQNERGAVFVEYSILIASAVFMAFALQSALVGQYVSLGESYSESDQSIERSWENGFLIESFSNASLGINGSGGGTTGDPPDPED